MTEKTFHLFKEDGESFAQENSSLSRLRFILNDFVFDHYHDSLYCEEVALAKRLVAFILSDDLEYFDK